MEVFLIRTAPETGHEIPAHARRTPALCFFHGDGVEHALDPVVGREWAEAAAEAEAELDLMVCETALARRTKEALKPPWRTGSLAQFWQAVSRSCAPPFFRRGDGGDASEASRFSSLTLGIPPNPPSQAKGGIAHPPEVLIRVAAFGDDRFNREVLELCLAGAALEVDLAVCFAGAGLELLKGPESAAWRQFPDFELAPLYYVADREFTLDVPARRLDRSQAEHMTGEAGRVIDV